MCGIFGEVSSRLTEKNIFLDLNALSLQRGPDQQGYWSDEVNCQFAFNRLSILDTSINGLQPMRSPDERYTIVFNGEVYNHKDLMHKFGIERAHLKSSSDTEVLVNVLGKCTMEEFARKLNGMFAIAVFDRQDKQVTLIRDFAGIKPLFYGLSADGIVFASQFDQVFKHPAFSNEHVLRPEVMKEYFALGYMPAPNTIFENIFQVEPGEMITYSLSEQKVVHKTKYYTWHSENTNPETSPQTIDRFESMFKETIKEQLVSDVPLATFLSGGIDSPLVTAFSAEHKKTLHAYTFEVDNPDMNEAPFASQYARHLKVNHSIENLEKDNLINMVDEHFKGMPEPHGDFSSLPTYLISKKARHHATVMLSGDGGDELYWGYPRFLRQVDIAPDFRYPFFLRKILLKGIRKFTNRSITYALDYCKRFDEWTFNLQSRFSANELNAFFPNVAITSSVASMYSYKGSLTNKTELLNWLKWNEFYGHLQRVLRKVDMASMANSLEVRVPFLDKRSIEFSNSVKPELGSRHTNLKNILKKALSRYIPESIIMKGKRGFSFSVGDLLRNEMKDDLIKCCVEDRFYGGDLINADSIRNYVSDFIEGKHDNAWGVWHFYAWQKWAQHHVLQNNYTQLHTLETLSNGK